MLSFQEIILIFQKFWVSKGFLLTHPYDMEMGAATFHPQTALKSLGNKNGNLFLYSPVGDLLMVGMEKTQTGCNITINFK